MKLGQGDGRRRGLLDRGRIGITALAGLMLAALLLVGMPLRSQEKPENAQNPAKPENPEQAGSQQKPKISVQVKVVSVVATVRNAHGNVVFDLGKDDFVLEEDGHEQAITYFSRELDLPLTLGLLVDTSLSQRRVLPEERTASYSFLDNLLRADTDKAFLIHFDREVELLQDLTASRDKLDHALSLLSLPDSSSSGDARGRGGRRFGGGTLLYDAVYLAATELMQKQTGRKALIILSDGVDRGSKKRLADAVDSAQRADTLVYSILFPGEEGYGGGRGYGGYGGRGGGRYPQEERPDGKKVLKQISAETGARLFEVSKKQTIDQIFAQIEQELRSQYSLGFAPAGPDAGPGYHKLSLRTKQKDMTVQARSGFYAEP